jgi:Tfp pilus assembly protein PilV
MKALSVACRSGFSLLEVVLAIGILGLSILALVGLGGPLLRQMAEERQGAELEAVLAATREWVSRAAAEDFDAFARSFEGGARVLYAYRLEALSREGEAGWTVSEPAGLAGAGELSAGEAALDGPFVFRLELEALPAPPDAPERGWLPLRVELRAAPVPEPGADLREWSARVRAGAPGHRFHLVALP